MDEASSRVLCKGAISFGLLHIPLGLHSATTESGLDFDWLDKHINKKLENTSPKKTSSRASLTKHVKTSYRATRKLLDEALDPGHASLLEIPTLRVR